MSGCGVEGVEEDVDDMEGELYIHVAPSTVPAPITNEGVIVKSNNTTEAKKLNTIDKLVANPLRMLSLYLITTAVTSPPNTCIETVAQAQGPKWRKRSLTKPRDETGGEAYKMGRRAGISEKSESWTFLTQRSDLEPFKTISK